MSKQLKFEDEIKEDNDVFDINLEKLMPLSE